MGYKLNETTSEANARISERRRETMRDTLKAAFI